MSTDDRAGLETSGTDDRCIDERDQRALGQFLTVLPETGRARGADDLFLVVSESGSEYLVDARDQRCTCPDHEYRGVRCKHLRRVAIARGDRPVSAAELAAADVDPQLGQHTAGPRVVTSDGGIIEAGDEGEVLKADGDAGDRTDDVVDLAGVTGDAPAEADDGAERPADCTCEGPDDVCVCLPCYMAGFAFDDPNPEPPTDEEAEDSETEADR